MNHADPGPLRRKQALRSTLVLVLVAALGLVRGSSTAAGAAMESSAARADSAARESVPGFHFLYETGWGTKIDTRRGLYTKDLVVGPDTTIALILSAAEMDSIYRTMIAIGFFDLPEPHPPYPHVLCTSSPSTSIRIEATAGRRTRRLSWSTRHCVEGPWVTTGPWRDLSILSSVIRGILDRRPESQALPRPRGAYL